MQARFPKVTQSRRQSKQIRLFFLLSLTICLCFIGHVEYERPRIVGPTECLHMYRNASRAKQPLIRYNVNIALVSSKRSVIALGLESTEI